MADDDRRSELAAFLRARRSQVDRISLGLPARNRRGTRGLRREEVATLSGVSVTWYTWLEQARDVNPSRQVLDALARALQLSAVEQNYLLSLAGLASPPRVDSAESEVPEHVRHLLDALVGSPAFAITSDWWIKAWNDDYRALYPNVAIAPPDERNLLWAVFADPSVRELLPDWDVTSRRFLAEFRADVGTRLARPAVTQLVEQLCERSPEFRAGWNRYDIEGFASRLRSFNTAAGPLDFEHHRVAVSGEHDLYLVIYTPANAHTAQRLSDL